MRTWAAAVLAVVLATSMASGAIVNVDVTAGSEGVAVDGYTWNQSTVDIAERLSAVPGTIFVDITLDSYKDPTVWLVKRPLNGTTFDWTGYRIEVGAPLAFSIDDTDAPAGWTADYDQPVLQGGKYVSTVEFTYGGAGTQIDVGQWAMFGLLVTFEGDVQFCMHQVPLPEPASLLLVLSGIAIRFVRRRR